MTDLIKKSFRLEGHATSVALEPEFWAALQEVATAQNRSLTQLVCEVDLARTKPLASALRVYALAAARAPHQTR